MSLKGKNELERFTEKCGYDIIFAAISEWISQNPFDVDGNDAALDDIGVKFTRNLCVDGCRFSYDAVIEAYIAYKDYDGENTQASQWFTVVCTAEVDDTLQSFEVSSVDIYAKIANRENNSTENFVPIISKIQMDNDARVFLSQHCPEALIQPTQVPIREIADKMGLTLEFGYILSEDFSYLGQISFSDTKTRVFDLDSGESSELNVTRGTILIDPGIFWERSVGCENFTIAHEIVHWEKHKLFADIKRLLYRGSYMAHRCPKPARIVWERDGDTWTENEWMEWHANGIGARILMPKETVPAKIEEIQATFSPELMADKTGFFITLIEELADFYGTSRLTTKRRLKELGYSAVNDIQINEYDFQAFTHEIDEYKAFYELCENPELKMLLDISMFVYAEQHFVINHEKCVTLDEDGIPRLTDYTWENLDRCTLKFANVRINIKEDTRHFSDILYREKIYETFQRFRRENNDAAFEAAKGLAADFNTTMPRRREQTVTFVQRVKGLLDDEEINQVKFTDLTTLSKATYYRLLDESKKPSFHTVLSLCAGLDFDIDVTNDLLQKAALSFDGSVEHKAYAAAITNFTGKPIEVRNEFLCNLNIEGVRPLGEET